VSRLIMSRSAYLRTQQCNDLARALAVSCAQVLVNDLLVGSMVDARVACQ